MIWVRDMEDAVKAVDELYGEKCARISELEDTVEDLESQVEGLQDEVCGMEDDLEELRIQLADCDADIIDLTKQLEQR